MPVPLAEQMYRYIMGQGSGFTGLLDTYTGAAAAYSVRKLKTGATNSLRVRRSSDDAEQDIGFDANGDLDTTALLAFVGTGGTDNGYVTTFYDQSGNGNNATNATSTEQPLVVSGGTLVEENGKAAIQFDGVDDEFGLSGLLSGATEFTYISVDSPSATNVRSNYWAQLTDLSNVNTFFRYGSNAKIEIFLGDGTTALDSFTTSSSYTAAQNLQFINYDSSQSAANQIDVFVNSTDLNASGSTAFGALNTIANAYIGSRDGATPFLGKMQEIIIFASDQSTNRTGMETNINDHFSIYTP